MDLQPFPLHLSLIWEWWSTGLL